MILAAAFAAGVAPALFWLAYFYRYDRFEPEPKRLVLETFGYGALATIPAFVLESLAPYKMLPETGMTSSVVEAAAAAFAVVAPIEEGLKFLAVRLTIYRTSEFDEPIDGLIYAASAALGFAALENVGYVLAHGGSVMVGRSIFSTLGHVLFAAPWGLALGLRRCTPGVGPLTVAGGLVVGTLLHGTYDALLFFQRIEASAAFLFVAFPLMVLVGRASFRYAAPLSRFAPVSYCGQCGAGLRAGAAFCPGCGHAAAARLNPDATIDGEERALASSDGQRRSA